MGFVTLLFIAALVLVGMLIRYNARWYERDADDWRRSHWRELRWRRPH